MGELFYPSWQVDFTSVLDGTGQISKYLGNTFYWTVSYHERCGEPARKHSERIPVRIKLLRFKDNGIVQANGNIKMYHSTSQNSLLTLCGIEKFSFTFEDGQSSREEFLTFVDQSFNRCRYSFFGTLKVQPSSCTAPLKQCIVQSSDSSNPNLLAAFRVLSLTHMSGDFKSLLNKASSRFSDVTMVCDGVSIPAHRCILSVRSPVFEVMFRNNMKDGIVAIDDVTLRALKAILSYIYSGNICKLDVPLASEILCASDKYALEDLKEICSKYLISEINVENALRIAAVGDLHDENLKLEAIHYICSHGNITVFRENEDWDNLKTSNPYLPRDIISAVGNMYQKRLRFPRKL